MSRQHKEFLNKHKLTMLQKASKIIIEKGINEVQLKEFSDNVTDYANFQKLRYSGLIFKVRRGTWGITRNGWSFLRNELRLPKYVIVQDNHIVERSPQTIGVKDVYRGSEAITTTFEYFLEDGTPIGVKPLEYNETRNQRRLFA